MTRDERQRVGTAYEAVKKALRAHTRNDYFLIRVNLEHARDELSHTLNRGPLRPRSRRRIVSTPSPASTR